MGEKSVPEIIKGTALFHHRRYRNSGYPNRPSRDSRSDIFYRKIPEEMRLVGICDVYDALTTSTAYRTGMRPRDGLRKIMNLSNNYFLSEDVQSFLRAVSLSLTRGEGFLLPGEFLVIESARTSRENANKKDTIHEFARILKVNGGRPLEPTIRLFYNITDKKRMRHIDVDLRLDPARRVIRITEDSSLREKLFSIFSQLS